MLNNATPLYIQTGWFEKLLAIPKGSEGMLNGFIS